MKQTIYITKNNKQFFKRVFENMYYVLQYTESVSKIGFIFYFDKNQIIMKEYTIKYTTNEMSDWKTKDIFASSRAEAKLFFLSEFKKENPKICLTDLLFVVSY